jgi:hypothetical protein
VTASGRSKGRDPRQESTNEGPLEPNCTAYDHNARGSGQDQRAELCDLCDNNFTFKGELLVAREEKKSRSGRKKRPPLESRFTFLGDAVAAGERKALRPAQFQVIDNLSGIERSLKLWRKTGATVDADLRELWLHEMRQVQRVMSYSGARETIVDILEFVEDDEELGVLLEAAGQPLAAKRQSVSRQHWLKNLGAPRPRALFWRNIRRIVDALGIVHAQGLVHGNLSMHSLMTEGAEDPGVAPV